MTKGETIAFSLIGAFLIIVLIVITCCTCCKRKKRPQTYADELPPQPVIQDLHTETPPTSATTSTAETFLATPQKVTMSPAGAITGNGILTNQMVRMTPAEITNQVNSNGYINDGSISMGIGVGNGFDQPYSNQLDIQSIGAKAMGGYETNEQLKEITQKIVQTSNNNNNNLFTRAGDKPTKLYLAPNEVRCVIDEAYLPARDKNQQIASVGTVIPTQGYDLNVERIGEQLTGTHFSATSFNKCRKRIPTAAGATAVSGGEGANADAVQQSINVTGDTLNIEDTIAGGSTVNVKLDPDAAPASETFKRKYVK